MTLVGVTAPRINGAISSRLSKLASLERSARHIALRGLARLRRPMFVRQLADVNVYHSPYFALPPETRQKGVHRFITVNDIIPLLHPEWFASEGEHYFADIIRSIHPEDWIFVPSESTKSDLCTYRVDLSADRIIVTPWAADPTLFYRVTDTDKLDAVRNRYKIPSGRYLLALGNLEPRKNLDRLINAFAYVIQQKTARDLNLVLAGKSAWKFDSIFASIRSYPQLENRIVVTGYVAEDDLASLYSGAIAFVYPSLYEGFGLPPLEAMQCGVPVVASNTSSLPEVIGPSGALVDPCDVEAIASGILKLLSDETYRATMREQSLARAALFQWSHSVSGTLTGYRYAMMA